LSELKHGEVDLFEQEELSEPKNMEDDPCLLETAGFLPLKKICA